MYGFRDTRSARLTVGWVFAIFLTMGVICPTILWGQVEFFQILPNTVDDTNLEYIELRNTACESIDIGGYILEDASAKQYVFPSPTVIASHETLHIGRPTSKIILNNTDETLYLKRLDTTIADQFSYPSSTKGEVVVDLTVVDEICTPPIDNTGSGSSGSTIPTDSGSTGTGSTGTGSTGTGSTGTGSTGTGSTGTGSTGTGSTGTGSTGTGVIPPVDGSGVVLTGSIDDQSGSTSSGIIIDGGSGTTSSGVVSTGTGGGGDSQGSGTTSTGSIPPPTGTTLPPTDTGTGTGTGSTGTGGNPDTSTGVISSGSIIFPYIFPTLQQPTNATFSGDTFDCTGLTPCRINITLESIFTGAYLARNYTCEVVTETGSVASCNPNTIYFSTGGTLTVHVKSKIDTTRSSTTVWYVRYGSVSQSGSTIPPTQSGSSGGVLSGSVFSGTVTFPDIVPVYQNYTNITHSGDTLICTTTPCRVNMTLEPIFTGAYLARDYACEVRYGTGVYDCNPPQLYLIGTGAIDITITHKASQATSRTSLAVVQHISSQSSTQNPGTQPGKTSLDTTPPVIVLEYDGKLKSYHEIVGDYELNCYTLTCAVNLTAEKSYDGEGGSVRFIWYYRLNDIKTTKDPGERKYGLGDHVIWLRVIDTSGNVAEVRYHIHVLGPHEKPEKVPEEKKEKVKKTPTEKIVAEKTKKKKKAKPKKTVFFDPPDIILQSSKFVKTEDGYECRTTAKTCSLNLSLSGLQQGIIYTWVYSDGDTVVSKNPKSKPFPIGTSTVHVSAGYNTGATLWSQDIRVKVISTKKPKKAKVKKVSVKKPKSPRKNTVPVSEEKPVQAESDRSNLPLATLALVSGVVPILVFRKVSDYKNRKVNGI